MISTIFFDLNNVIEIFNSVDDNINNISFNTIKKNYSKLDNAYIKEKIEINFINFKDISNNYPFQYYYIFWKELFKKIFNEEPSYKDVIKLYDKFIDEYIESIKIYPDTVPALENLKDNYNLAIIANGNYERCNRLLNHHKLKKYFSQIITSDEIGVKKPDKMIFQIALNLMNTIPEQAVMIGDRIDTDIVGANAIGMHTIRILRGKYSNQSPISIDDKPDFEIHSLMEIEKIISHL